MSKRNAKILERVLAEVFDALLLVASLYLAKLMRGSLIREYNENTEQIARMYAPLFIFIHLLALNVMGIYRVTWKYADLKDMLRLFGASLLASAVSLSINSLFSPSFSRAALTCFSLFSANIRFWISSQV